MSSTDSPGTPSPAKPVILTQQGGHPANRFSGLDDIFYSADIESTGPTTGKHSMISLGVCVVGAPHLRFYAEIKPLPGTAYDIDAMRIAVLGMRILRPRAWRLYRSPAFDPGYPSFDPDAVLDALRERALEPTLAMDAFVSWVESTRDDHRPILAAAPLVFDAKWVDHYLGNYSSKGNPFGYNGHRSFGDLYLGMKRDWDASLKHDSGANSEPLPHNALEDAIIQERMFAHALDLFLKKGNYETKGHY